MMSSIYPATPASSARDGISRAWMEVDLGAVVRNAEQLQRAARTPLVAMVKADAYGLGAVPVARALAASPVVPWAFGVATLEEAAELRAAGITARIICCTPLLQGEFADAIALQLRPALHDTAAIDTWHAHGGGAWHLAIDTGMARSGVRWDDVSGLRDVLRRHQPEGVFTHFHSAELPNDSRIVQDRRFDDALEVLRDVLPRDVLVHSDNSAGIAARFSVGSTLRRDLARAGIGLYGAFVAQELGLEPTVQLHARVIDLRVVHAGETVGYGAEWVADGTRRIATISIGHGDGFRRALTNRGFALVSGQRVAVVGVVSMDMTTIDVTDVPCEVGDVVTLLGGTGEHALTIDNVAAAGTVSPYELLVGLRLRVPRHYRA